MGKIGEKLDIDFVVSTGDNFYDNGLKSEDDIAFEESFTKIYTHNSLQTKWYSVLGNHDYRGDAEAQLSPLLRKIDNRWICLRSFLVNAELADIIFLDTTPFVDMYFSNPEGHTYDWRAISSRKDYISSLLMDVEKILKESRATWKIVVGHHAIRSVGHHGDTKELIEQLLPILEANEVDFYMNGHDHCLEHVSDTNSPIQFLTSGAGSKAWRGDIKGLNKEGLKFFYDGQEGFSSLIQKTKVNRALHGYCVVHGPPSITHMLFADDNYLFCQGTTGAASSVVNLLRVSEGASGKEILLKTIIQSLPTYAMSVFLLLIGTCHEIEEAMARFWWKPNSSKKVKVLFRCLGIVWLFTSKMEKWVFVIYMSSIFRYLPNKDGIYYVILTLLPAGYIKQITSHAQVFLKLNLDIAQAMYGVASGVHKV
uniref:acid phosphatase n=1 Tax=Cannabis sativa TaxID=3483 RepID=A0A803P7T7_CANSA